MATSFNPTDIITILVASNPKLPSSSLGPRKAAQRYMLYRNGMTVAEYKAACLAPENAAFAGKGYAAADLQWDTKHGHIKITPANVQAEKPAAEPAAKSAPAKAPRKAGKRK